MKNVRGFWLPNSEQHLVEFLENGPEFASGPTYQLHKYLAALPHVKNFRHAVDVGAHCGLWSRVMAACFSHVSAFEPVPDHAKCWHANVPVENTMLHECALGKEPKDQVFLHTGPSSTGDTYVRDQGEHSAPMRTLDSFAFDCVDFVKIDCEGYELYVLQGGEVTINRWKPVIVVEQKPNKGTNFGLSETAAVDWLHKRGYRTHKVIAGDYIMVP